MADMKTKVDTLKKEEFKVENGGIRMSVFWREPIQHHNYKGIKRTTLDIGPKMK